MNQRKQLRFAWLFLWQLCQGGVAAAPATITGALHCQPFPEERSSVATALVFAGENSTMWGPPVMFVG